MCFVFSIIKWTGPNKKYPLVHFSSHVLLLALSQESKAEAGKEKTEVVMY